MPISTTRTCAGTRTWQRTDDTQIFDYSFVRTYGAPAVRPPSTTMVCPLIYEESSAHISFPEHDDDKAIEAYLKPGKVRLVLPLGYVSICLVRYSTRPDTYQHPDLVSSRGSRPPFWIPCPPSWRDQTSISSCRSVIHVSYGRLKCKVTRCDSPESSRDKWRSRGCFGL